MGKLITFGGICGILTSWNAFFLAASRVLFAMGRMGMLPEKFVQVHPKYGSPYIAVIVVGAITCFAPLLSSDALLWFVNAGGLGTMVAYLTVVASFIKLRRTRPDLIRPYNVPHWRLVGLGAALSSLFFPCPLAPVP